MTMSRPTHLLAKSNNLPFDQKESLEPEKERLDRDYDQSDQCQIFMKFE